MSSEIHPHARRFDTIGGVRAGASLMVIGVFMAGGSSAFAAGPQPGDVIVGDSERSKVYWLEPDTGDKHVLSKDDRLVSPNDSAFSPNGKRLYVADYNAFGGGGGVFKLNPRTGATRVLSDDVDFEQPDGIDVGPDGTVWVADLDASVDDGALLRVNPDDGEADFVSSGAGLVNATGVVVPNTGKPFVSGLTTDSVVKVNPDNGDQTVVADSGDGLTASGGIARGSDGLLYLADSNNSIVQSVDPKTADVNEVADAFGNEGYGVAMDRRDRLIGCSDDLVNRANTRNGDVDEIGSNFGYAEGVEVVPR